MDTIPNGHNPEWTQSRMDTILNGCNPKRALTYSDNMDTSGHRWLKTDTEGVGSIWQANVGSTLVFGVQAIVRLTWFTRVGLTLVFKIKPPLF